MSEETRGYKDLIVWQKAMDLVPEVYKVVRQLPTEERFGLSDQIRRAVISVPANIAEGQGRRHAKEFSQFLGIARGSLAELDTLLIAACRLGFLDENQYEVLSAKMVDVRRPLQGLIQSLQKP